ncbi:MAG: hypothetical protein HQK97_05265 [Nitrospirae bacterium]|nr:hypothetical protein [Nitrospirota bacterium]
MRQYSQNFWIQGQDGKMEGSLPGVPKRGGTHDTEKTREPNHFVARLRKRMEAKRNNSVALVTDEKASFFEKLEKGAMKKAEENIPAFAELNAEKQKMEATIARVGEVENGKYRAIAGTVDKYYHAVAHCKAARRGISATVASHVLGVAKELFDIPRKVLGSKCHHLPTDEVNDSIGDMAANAHGRDKGLHGDPTKSCEELCKDKWPKGIPEKYKK